MKKLAASLLTLSLLSPTLAMAHGGGPGGHGFNILPDAAAAVVIGGLTYWALNGNYYQKHGDQYVEVQAPPQDEAQPQDEAPPPPPPADEEEEYDSAPPDLTPLDFHGERFYVSHGHYYQRDPSGQYFEIPRPDGL